MINLLCLAGIAIALVVLRDDKVISIGLASISIIAFIIFGEKGKHEEKWENQGFPGREAVAPVATLAAYIVLGTISLERTFEVINRELDIIALILSFAVVANGLSRCGFIDWAAYKVVSRCGGDTRRLIIYIFILASALTLVTSNDIVVLGLTPIIYAICVNANISNGRLLFLAQFVAANTLSMGLMIGSPTNIIVAERLDINFIEYFVLMGVPAIFSFFLTMVVVDAINRRSQVGASGFSFQRFTDWDFKDTYNVPARAPYPYITNSMKNWFRLFILAVFWLAIVTSVVPVEFQHRLLLVAIPLIIACAGLTVFELNVDDQYNVSGLKKSDVLTKTMFSLPYGIIFFAFSFFVFAEELARSDEVKSIAINFLQFAETNPLFAGPLGVFLAGFGVNVVNDLPASAMLGGTFAEVTANQGTYSDLTLTVLQQAILVGLNIGCYVTPVGALAGLIWFNQMRLEARRQRELHDRRIETGRIPKDEKFVAINIPSRKDLIIYGSVNFLIVGIMLGLFVPFLSVVLDFLVHPVSQFATGSFTNTIPYVWWILIIGSLISAAITYRSRKVIKDEKVALSHIAEVFSALNALAIWSYKNRVKYIVGVLLAFIAVCSAILYWAETTSIERYGASNSATVPLGDPISFISWFFVFVGSTFENGQFPQSLFGHLVAGVVPLSAIAAVLYIVRSTSRENLENLRHALGKGDIPNYRIIIVNFQLKFQDAVLRMLEKRDGFVVLLCDDKRFERAEAFANDLIKIPSYANRVLVERLDEDAYATLHRLDFPNAGEIYFLADMTTRTDIDNMRMLTRIDAWLNAKRLAARRELSKDKTIDVENLDPNRSYGEFFSIPKIFFEVSSRRQLDRVKSALSDLMLYQTHLTRFDDVVVNQISADIFGDVELSNKRMKFCENAQDEGHRRLFIDGKLPFEGFRLIDQETSVETTEELQDLFREHVEREKTAQRSIRNHSVNVRVDLFNVLKTAKFKKPVDEGMNSPTTSIIGISALIDRRKIRMSAANAAVSSQAQTACGVLALVRDGSVKLSEKSLSPSKQQNLFLFNFNPYTDALVRSIISSGLSDRVRTIIMINDETVIPDDISNAVGIEIKRFQNIEDAIGFMSPKKASDNFGPLSQSPEIPNYNGVESGDSVIVFTDYEDELRSNVEVIQFIEGLDYRLEGPGGRGRDQLDLFFSVECNNEETRFLFEHLSVDKIIDTSRLRRSFLEQVGEFYHGFRQRMRDETFAKEFSHRRFSQFHPTTYNFRRALEFAEYFKPYVVDIADKTHVTDDNGISVSVVGKKIGDVVELLDKYSEPPLVLISVCRLQPVEFRHERDGEVGAGASLKRIEFDPEYIIKPQDCLIFAPLL